MKHQASQKRIEIIHQARMAAMDKGIPLPEFPLEPVNKRQPDNVIPILGMVLVSLSVGTMIVLYVIVSAPQHTHLWVAPLPFAFLGAGRIAFHLLNDESRR
jgi:CHASE1-domain containing sensor protein